MKFKGVKPYWFVGTIATVGIVTIEVYNFMITNTNKKTEEAIIKTNQTIKEEKKINNLNTEQTQIVQEELNVKQENEIEETQTIAEKNNESNKENKVSERANSTKKVVTTVAELKDTNSKIENENKNEAKEKLIEEKNRLVEEEKIYSNREEELMKLKYEQEELTAKKIQLENEIRRIKEATRAVNIEATNKLIEELTLKADSAEKESIKEKYTKEIENLKKHIKEYQEAKEQWTNLENELEELEKEIQEKNFDEEIKKIALSEQETERYSTISSRIKEINEELLKY